MPEQGKPEIRVIHINTQRGWRGGERQVLNLARQLQADGIAQILAAKKGSELACRAREHGILVKEFPFRGEWDIFSAQGLFSLAGSFSANILHAHTAKAHSIGLWARKKLSKAKPENSVFFIVSRRVDFPIQANFLSKKKYFDPLVDAYIAISKNIERRLLADGIPKEKIFLAYSGIDLSLWKKTSDPVALRSELRLHPDMLLIGNVAALEKHKDHKTLLSAVALLNDFTDKILPRGGEHKLPSWRLLILGEGSLKKSLLREAQRLGILYPQGPVQFLGYQKNIYEYYSLFDAFVLSSQEEGLGTAVLDAMAAGLAVVATRAGGIPEMVEHKKGGLLSSPGDAEALSKNLYRILTDSDFRSKAFSYNKKQVRKFSHEASYKANLDVYESLLRSKSP